MMFPSPDLYSNFKEWARSLVSSLEALERQLTLGDQRAQRWIDPTYNTNWSGATVHYAKLNGVVYLQGGAVRSGAPTLPERILTLPPGFRPAVEMTFVTAWVKGASQKNIVTVEVDGDVIVEVGSDTVGGSQLVRLDGISFPVVAPAI